MGKVTCGRHGALCCWRGDACPKCDGTFAKVGRGDYCPKCTTWFKENGYIFSEYYRDWTKPEQDTAEAHEARLGAFAALITGAAQPRFAETEAGTQTVIEDTPARSVPETALKPPVKQSEEPFALELASVEDQQEKLL